MLEELSAKVRSGEINPVDLINESLRRIEAAEPLNAVVAPYTLFVVNAVAPNSGLFVRPIIIAPASRSRAKPTSRLPTVQPVQCAR